MFFVREMQWNRLKRAILKTARILIKLIQVTFVCSSPRNIYALFGYFQLRILRMDRHIALKLLLETCFEHMDLNTWTGHENKRGFVLTMRFQ